MALFGTFTRWIGFRVTRPAADMRVPLVASFWNGGAPKQCEIKRVDRSGAYLLTADRWYPGTVVVMTLHYDPYYLRVAAVAGDRDASVRARGRVVAPGPDGVEVSFVFLNDEEQERFERFLSGAEVPEAA